MNNPKQEDVSSASANLVEHDLMQFLGYDKESAYTAATSSGDFNSLATEKSAVDILLEQQNEAERKRIAEFEESNKEYQELEKKLQSTSPKENEDEIII